ncbi:MAG: cytochrome c biogenesis protein CcdA [Candidatus Thermoplasmatota archaeon]
MADNRGPRSTGAYDNRVIGLWLVLALLLAWPAASSAWSAFHTVRPAPDFALVSTGLEDGVEGAPVAFSLHDYRGKTVVLDLMAVACLACRDVTRDILIPLAAEHRARDDFAILSVDTWADPETGSSWGGETAENLRELQRRENAPWRHALDTDQVWLKYSAITLPRVVVVDSTGQVVFDQVGVPDSGAVEAAVATSLAATATPVPFLSLGLPALAFVAGLASVASPCSVGLVPAYFGLLVKEGGTRRSVLRAGLASAAGAVSLYGVLALGFALVPSLGETLPWMGPAIALLMIAAGLSSLAGKGLPGMGALANRVDGRRGFFAFGFAFALAGFACTGPLFLPILAAGFNQGPADGVLLFALYALAIALALGLAAWMVAAGAQTRLRAALRHAPAIQRAAGALMVLSGGYLLWYFLR